LFIVVLTDCEDKDEDGGSESDSGPSCFSLSAVSHMCPYFVWLDITHIRNGWFEYSLS